MTASPSVPPPPVGFFSTPDRKRFQETTLLLLLREDGTIAEVTPGARRLLEYGADDVVDPCFFTHVHQRNLYQVMRDVAEMVTLGKSRASWLVRLKTGRQRWMWFKATVRNHLGEPDRAISVELSSIRTLVV